VKTPVGAALADAEALIAALRDGECVTLVLPLGLRLREGPGLTVVLRLELPLPLDSGVDDGDLPDDRDASADLLTTFESVEAADDEGLPLSLNDPEPEWVPRAKLEDGTDDSEIEAEVRGDALHDNERLY
jgi:hypothetical protein